jgi:hypothetical protein
MGKRSLDARKRGAIQFRAVASVIVPRKSSGVMLQLGV